MTDPAPTPAGPAVPPAEGRPTVQQILTKTQAFFADRGLDSPRADALLLVGDALGLERIQLLMQHDRPLSDAELEAVRERVRRRAKREPTHLILGERGFYTIDLKVIPGVLLPRPDTERLIEAALAALPAGVPAYVADIGCGSGAIGLTLAHERPELRVYCVDIAPEPLACTKDNAARLHLSDRVAVLRGDLLSPIPEARPIDLVISNPPYIPHGDIAGLDPEVRDWEPHLALDGGPDGLDLYRRLLPEAARRARHGVLVEIGWDQGPAVAALFREVGLTDVKVLKDYGGRDRVVSGWRPDSAWRPPAAPITEDAPTQRADAAPTGDGELVVELFDAVPDPGLAELPVYRRDD